MMRITICDDDIRICEVFRSAVQRLYPSASVSIFTDAGKLLREESSPDILLMDIKMPGVSGMEAAKKLRDEGWKGILIFITGNEEKLREAQEEEKRALAKAKEGIREQKNAQRRIRKIREDMAAEQDVLNSAALRREERQLDKGEAN